MRINTVNLEPVYRFDADENAGPITDIWGNDTLVISVDEYGNVVFHQRQYAYDNWETKSFDHKYKLEAIKVSPNMQTVCFFCEQEQEKEEEYGKEGESNVEEYVIVYSLAKEDPETYLKIPEVKIDKLILDIEEYTDQEARPGTIFGLFKGGD